MLRRVSEWLIESVKSVMYEKGLWWKGFAKKHIGFELGVKKQRSYE